jgi:putative ABC transport system permease protein
MLIISYTISFPIAYYFMNGWLRNFAYRGAMGWKVFGSTIIVSIALVLITVSYRAIRAALLNPVESLKTE